MAVRISSAEPRKSSMRKAAWIWKRCWDYGSGWDVLYREDSVCFYRAWHYAVHPRTRREAQQAGGGRGYGRAYAGYCHHRQRIRPDCSLRAGACLLDRVYDAPGDGLRLLLRQFRLCPD